MRVCVCACVRVRACLLSCSFGQRWVAWHSEYCCPPWHVAILPGPARPGSLRLRIVAEAALGTHPAQQQRAWLMQLAAQVLHRLPCASAANEHPYHLYFARSEYRDTYMRKWTFGPCGAKNSTASVGLRLRLPHVT